MTLTDKDMKWIGVDLDGTLAKTTAPDYKLEYPLPGAVDAMRKLTEEGWKIVIYTSRHWADYQMIEEWCELWEIPVRRILCGKPLFYRMIDDRNIEFDGDWEKAVDKLLVARQ